MQRKGGGGALRHSWAFPQPRGTPSHSASCPQHLLSTECRRTSACLSISFMLNRHSHEGDSLLASGQSQSKLMNGARAVDLLSWTRGPRSRNEPDEIFKALMLHFQPEPRLLHKYYLIAKLVEPLSPQHFISRPFLSGRARVRPEPRVRPRRTRALGRRAQPGSRFEPLGAAPGRTPSLPQQHQAGP